MVGGKKQRLCLWASAPTLTNLRKVALAANIVADRGTQMGEGSISGLLGRIAGQLEVADGQLIMKPIELGEPAQASLLLETLVAVSPIPGGGTDE